MRKRIEGYIWRERASQAKLTHLIVRWRSVELLMSLRMSASRAMNGVVHGYWSSVSAVSCIRLVGLPSSRTMTSSQWRWFHLHRRQIRCRLCHHRRCRLSFCLSSSYGHHILHQVLSSYNVFFLFLFGFLSLSLFLSPSRLQ